MMELLLDLYLDLILDTSACLEFGVFCRLKMRMLLHQGLYDENISSFTGQIKDILTLILILIIL